MGKLSRLPQHLAMHKKSILIRNQCLNPTRLRAGAHGSRDLLMTVDGVRSGRTTDGAKTMIGQRGGNTTGQEVEVGVETEIEIEHEGGHEARKRASIEGSEVEIGGVTIRSKGPLPSQVDAFKTTTNKDSPSPAPEKQKPNFRPSGLLAKVANTVATSSGAIVLKYHEPPEARKPPSSQTWRLYVFKGDEILDTLDLYTQSCWLFGREVSVCDYALEHPSCSKQHAVIQFRYIERRNEFGDKIGKVKPYVIDLESANGTKVNDEAIPEGRYVELRDKDVIKFGHSTREYVVQLPPR
ncbi:hypothetical protein HRR78_004875 [Exophiala dermatitidis]|nr:hypothetical protein HRR78_004875 [Exophiala dermatitidis]